MKNRIITISREFGSGGRTIGKNTAKELGIPCYDNELIQKLAEESGFNESYIQDTGEYAPGGTISSAFSRRGYGRNNADYLWELQYKIIVDLAEKGPCVIVGRCADYILRDDPACLSFFIHSSVESRVQKTVERHGVTVEEAKNMMEKTDKSRAAYYNYYTNKTWGMASSYNFSIDVSVLGIDETVEFMKSFIERRLNKRPPHFG